MDVLMADSLEKPVISLSGYEQFIDLAMPDLTPYATAVYLFLLRNSQTLDGRRQIRIGKRAIAERFARGARGERVNYRHITNIVAELEEKGCVNIGDTTREGTIYVVTLPADIPLVQEKLALEKPTSSIEENYFTDPERRAEIFARDQWTCVYCGEKLAPENATLDHFFPQHLGGKHTADNLRTACFLCNSIKSGKTYAEAAPFLLKSIRDRRIRRAEPA